MRYTRASDILPAELIAEIQKYADGQYIYIPRQAQARRIWGQNTGSREVVRARNQRICAEHRRGDSIRVLAERYYLAEKTVSAIVRAAGRNEKLQNEG